MAEVETKTVETETPAEVSKSEEKVALENLISEVTREIEAMPEMAFDPVDFEKVEAMMLRIKRLSGDVLGKALPIMRNLKGSKSPILEDFLDEHPEGVGAEDAILERLRIEMLSKIGDAEASYAESQKFVLTDAEGKKRLNLVSEDDSDSSPSAAAECPVLSHVWNGDFYDHRGLEDLEAFRKDLFGQLTRTTEACLIADVHKKMVADGSLTPKASAPAKPAAKGKSLPTDLQKKRVAKKAAVEKKESA